MLIRVQARDLSIVLKSVAAPETRERRTEGRLSSVLPCARVM